MAFSRITYDYEGQSTFAINFTLGYLSTDHVTARVNEEVDGSNDPVYRDITFITAGTCSISGTWESGDSVVFERTTPKDELTHDYQNGSLLIESNLDDSHLQAIMIAHEALDGRLATFETDLDVGNHYITNVLDPVNAQDVATKNYIDTFEAINTAAVLTALAKAEQWAEEVEDTEVESGQYSALHHAAKSAASAAAAAVSAGALPQNNFSATSAPTSSDDTSSGYSAGSRWVDTTGDESYICVDATESAAVWLNSTLTSDELGTLSVLDEITFSLISSSSIATQANAEGGTSTDKLVTPFRTAQAMAARVDIDQDTTTTSQTTTSTSYVVVNNLSVSITPKDTSQKVEVKYNLSVHMNGSDDRYSRLQIMRQINGGGYSAIATAISLTDDRGGTGHRDMSPFCYIDEPSTTDQVDYKLQVLVSDAASTLELQKDSTLSNLIAETK